MNGLYDIILFLFILGAVTQGFQELGVTFGVSVPNSGLTISESTVTELESGATSTETSDYSTWTILMSFLRVIGSAVLACFTIIPLCISIFQAVGISFDISLILATILQAPVTLITMFGLYEFWTGRSVV